MNLTSNLARDAGVAELLLPLTAISCTLAFTTGRVEGISFLAKELKLFKQFWKAFIVVLRSPSLLGKDLGKCWKKMAPECNFNSSYFASLIIV
jgi:hypothetical protein